MEEEASTYSGVYPMEIRATLESNTFSTTNDLRQNFSCLQLKPCFVVGDVCCADDEATISNSGNSDASLSPVNLCSFQIDTPWFKRASVSALRPSQELTSRGEQGSCSGIFSLD